LSSCTAKILLRLQRGKISQTDLPAYGEGDVVTLMFVFDSVLVSVAGDGLTMVVLVSFFSVFSPPEGGLVTVVSFCSQAVSSAAPAKMQMYFFIFVSARLMRLWSG
ncbi:MAG: hypothetical protein DME34_02510, partial [Verrucomicrobia bacterium]